MVELKKQNAIAESTLRKLKGQLHQEHASASHSFSNILAVANKLRALTSGNQPQSCHISRQKISIDENRDLELQNILVEMADITLSDDSVLTLTVASVTGHGRLDTLNEQGTLNTDFTLENLQLSFDPPLGCFLQKIMKLDFPLSSNDLLSLRQEYKNIAQKLAAESPDKEVTFRSIFLRYMRPSVDAIGFTGENTKIISEGDLTLVSQAVASLTGIPLDKVSLLNKLKRSTQQDEEKEFSGKQDVEMPVISHDAPKPEASVAKDKIYADEQPYSDKAVENHTAKGNKEVEESHEIGQHSAAKEIVQVKEVNEVKTSIKVNRNSEVKDISKVQDNQPRKKRTVRILSSSFIKRKIVGFLSGAFNKVRALVLRKVSYFRK